MGKAQMVDQAQFICSGFEQRGILVSQKRLCNVRIGSSHCYQDRFFQEAEAAFLREEKTAYGGNPHRLKDLIASPFSRGPPTSEATQHAVLRPALINLYNGFPLADF
jgi:hypothetical protein